MKLTTFFCFFYLSIYSQALDENKFIGSWKLQKSNRCIKKLYRIDENSEETKSSIIFSKNNKLTRFFPHITMRHIYVGTKDEKWFIEKDSIISYTYKKKKFRRFKIEKITDSLLVLKKISLE